MITIYHKSIKEKKLQTLQEERAGSWLYVVNPSEKEMESLVTKHKLQKEHIIDALDPHEVPRYETEDGIAYIFTRVPLNRQRIVTIPVLFIITKDHTITISKEELPFKDQFLRDPAIVTTQKTKLLLQLFNNTILTYNFLVTGISRKVRAISINIESISNKEIVQFVGFESVLNDFLSSLVPTKTILRNILSGKHIKLYDEDKDLIEDLEIDSEQLVELCRSNLKNMVNVREAYSTIMTNNLNRVIKMLTGLTIILTVPMIIASLYGMNVSLPFSDSPLAFFYIIGFTGIISFFLLGILIRNRWL